MPRARRRTCSAQPGSGLRNFLAILDDGRIAIAALAVGCAQACLDLAVDYAKERQAFGGPIGRFQGLAFQLADLAVAVENSRNLTYGAARLKDHGKPFKQAAAMAKLYSTETAVHATRVATQVFGGAGFIEETPVARFYRDAKILEIGEGTSEIQRLDHRPGPRPAGGMMSATMNEHESSSTHGRAGAAPATCTRRPRSWPGRTSCSSATGSRCCSTTGSFVEDGLLANTMADDLPADGVVTGHGPRRRPRRCTWSPTTRR